MQPLIEPLFSFSSPASMLCWDPIRGPFLSISRSVRVDAATDLHVDLLLSELQNS